MTVSTTLDAIVALLRRADPSLVVGPPEASIDVLCVWPWRLAPTADPATPRPPRPGPPSTPGAPAFELHLLVVPPSTGALDGPLALVAGSPVLRATDATVRLTLGSGLAASDLAALFASAGRPVSACLELVARTTPDRP